MGMLQSKHACTRRESPEGGAFAWSAAALQEEKSRDRHKQVVCAAEPNCDQFHDHDCPLEVTLPPEKAAECQRHKPCRSTENVMRRNAKSHDTESNAAVVGEQRQEWMFTLYNFDNNGRVTKEDMCSLMHTIYEVVEASVKQSVLNNSKTLRIKLTLTPSCNRTDRDTVLSPKKQDQQEESRPSFFRGQSPDHQCSSEKKLYCGDENTERRNHYLDLAGIENYTSRFETDNTLQQPVESHQDNLMHSPRSGLHRRARPDICSPGKSSGHGISFLRSLRRYSKSIRASGGVSKSSRLHGHHPVSWCHPPQQQPQPPQHGHVKRVRARPRDATSPSTTMPVLDWELQTGAGAPPPTVVPMPQRHEHHHLHEHHHHHHHHHYYSS